MTVKTDKRPRVSNFWLGEYRCSDCGGEAGIDKNHIRVNHRKNCTLVKHLWKNYPRFMKTLERQRANG